MKDAKEMGVTPRFQATEKGPSQSPHTPLLFAHPALTFALHAQHQEDENDQKLDDRGRRALLAEARDLGAEAARWKVSTIRRVFDSRRSNSTPLGV